VKDYVEGLQDLPTQEELEEEITRLGKELEKLEIDKAFFTESVSVAKDCLLSSTRRWEMAKRISEKEGDAKYTSVENDQDGLNKAQGNLTETENEIGRKKRELKALQNDGAPLSRERTNSSVSTASKGGRGGFSSDSSGKATATTRATSLSRHNSQAAVKTIREHPDEL
jgi:hypothetical protein